MIREQISLVPAVLGDVAKLFKLRNDPFTVRYSRSGRTVPWAEHMNWYTRSVSDERHHRIYFIENGGKTVGVLRFERVAPSEAAISVYLLKHAVGHGLGPKSIQLGCELIFADWDIDRVVATIISGNPQSCQAFTKAGFVDHGDKTVCDPDLRMILNRPEHPGSSCGPLSLSNDTPGG